MYMIISVHVCMYIHTGIIIHVHVYYVRLSNLLIDISRDMITSVSLIVATPFIIKFLWLVHALFFF